MKKGDKSKKVIVYLKNRNDPSSYYRLYQYFYDKKNIKLINNITSRTYYQYYNNEKNCLLPKIFMIMENLIIPTFVILWDIAIYHSDIIIINRKIFPRKIPFYGFFLLKQYYNTRTVYWDFDDNIIEEGEITKKECNLLERYSDKIIVTNDYLKQTLSVSCYNKVILLSTTDKVFNSDYWDKIIDKRIKSYDKTIILIWVGTKGNLIFLKEILFQIKQAAKYINKKTGKKIILKCICNKELESKQYNNSYFEIENIRWNRRIALRELKKAHIGLMPLTDNIFTRGKAGFKAVQYIGAGIPAIVSDVGYNRQVIDNKKQGMLINKDAEWIEAIIELALDEKLWHQYSLLARKKWKDDFNSERHQKIWEELIKKSKGL